MSQAASDVSKSSLLRLLFQVGDWRKTLIKDGIQEISWQAGEYPNGEQWAKLDQPLKSSTIEVFARFGSEKLTDFSSLAQQVQTLLFLLEATRRQCDHLKLVLPYMPYSLQDRDVRGGDCVAAQVFISSVEAMGVDEVTLLDIHSPRDLSNWKIPITHLLAEDLLVSQIKENVKTQQVVILAPDKGAAHRAHQIGEKLDVPVTYLSKIRLGPGDVKIDTSNLDDLDAKEVVLVDDLLNTGGTLVAAAQALHERDPQVKVFVAITHGLFANDAIEKLRAAKIEKILVTDSFVGLDDVDFDFIDLMSVQKLLIQHD